MNDRSYKHVFFKKNSYAVFFYVLHILKDEKDMIQDYLQSIFHGQILWKVFIDIQST